MRKRLLIIASSFIIVLSIIVSSKYIYSKLVLHAWKRLDIEYLSQNDNKLYNACEVTSLLMGLHYKGYVLDKDIFDISDSVPKSDDPSKGFIYSIRDIYPNDKLHWIDSNALASFGKSYCNCDVVDSTGYSILDLDKELDKGNPIVIYLTSGLKDPINKGIPSNLHVYLLAGYNKITLEHYLIDPWRHSDGVTSWVISNDRINYIYNSVGKRSVIIK